MQFACFDTLDEDLGNLQHVEDWDGLRDSVRAILAPLGGEDFSIKLDPVGSEPAAPGHLLSTLPQAVARLFQEPSFSLYDPINQRFATSRLPQAWRTEDPSQEEAPAVYAFLHRLGIRHGLSLQHRSHQVTSRIDFYSRDDEWTSSPNAMRGMLVYLGLHVHEAAENVWRKEAAAADSSAALLSARELECLHWGALGKTSREIGMILGISQRTVYFHMNNAAAKLNVYSVKHAISRALSSGLVQIGA
jgi:DNA-binding CsgD family transcriptional regulator